MRILHGEHKRNHRKLIKSIGNEAFKIKKDKIVDKDEVIQNIIEKLHISEDVINGAEIISMVGKRNFVLENYVKVVEYGEEKIKVRTKRNYVLIEGERLKIEYMLDTQLRISGLISSISFM